MKHLPRVPFPPGTVVVGDLHLDLFDPGHVRPFVRWCAGVRAPRLVILGDLFEFWVGRRQLSVDGAGAALGALADVAARGVALDVLCGNRDFTLDRHFERASGASVWRSGLIGEHRGGPTLVLHGDELCTLDRSYQRFRRVVRAAPTRWLMTHLPFALQQRVAARLRRASVRAVNVKPAPTKAMQAAPADARARAAGAAVLICGHAHRFQDQALPGGARWLVIDGWGGRRDALRLGAKGDWAPCAAGELGA